MKIEKHILDNGLKVIVNQDKSSPLVAMNIIYDVGSRDEDPELTGFAHLFEHLMFGGSINIPEYDIPLQKAGGENNAFTNNDITNYYITVPYQNIETAFWLESDRMLDLDFSEEGLEIQKKVVIEEFKQRYFNQPYGDAWLHLRPLAYKVHPYMWPTIGKEISHIEKANLQNVKDFYYKHYAPNNAILSLSGGIDPDSAFKLAAKWFGPLEKRSIAKRILPAEPDQNEQRELSLKRPVPADSIYIAFHIPERRSDDFIITDLISDLLGSGNSSRLNQILVKEKGLFSTVDAYITGDIDPGLFILTGKPLPGVSIERAKSELVGTTEDLIKKEIGTRELEKVQNKFEANFLYSQTSILNKAMNLAYHELLDDASSINDEVSKYKKVSVKQIKELAGTIFREENTSILYYTADRK